MRSTIITILMVAGILMSACNKKDTSAPGADTTPPVIVKLTADKSAIRFGGDDPAIITCETTGGDMHYEWEVDLGDIFSLNEDGSMVRFTGSECCIGEKIITCTAYNDKGSVSETITINIFIP